MSMLLIFAIAAVGGAVFYIAEVATSVAKARGSRGAASMVPSAAGHTGSPMGGRGRGDGGWGKSDRWGPTVSERSK